MASGRAQVVGHGPEQRAPLRVDQLERLRVHGQALLAPTDGQVLAVQRPELLGGRLGLPAAVGLSADEGGRAEPDADERDEVDDLVRDVDLEGAVGPQEADVERQPGGDGHDDGGPAPADQCGEDPRDQEHERVGGAVEPGAQGHEHRHADGERRRPDDEAADGAARGVR